MRTLLRARHLAFVGLLIAFVVALPAASHAQVGVGVSITVAPPALPVYEQPPCPTEGFLWTPGYWAHGPDGYFWTPGLWVAPPHPGLLWTPGYWGFAGGAYGWHAGYWGPHVGFYGGINYGFGYGGVGFWGGRWEGGAFRYNTPHGTSAQGSTACTRIALISATSASTTTTALTARGASAQSRAPKNALRCTNSIMHIRRNRWRISEPLG